jgi:transcriptional regulator with XRE-family HTH domain
MSKQINFGKFLKERREQMGLSQAVIAEKMGYTTPQFVSNWERGIAMPPIKTLKKLAEMYKVPQQEMFDIVLQATVHQVKVDLHRKFYGKKAANF